MLRQLVGTYCEHIVLAPEPRAKVTVDDRLPQTHIVTFLYHLRGRRNSPGLLIHFSESPLLFPLLSGSSHYAFEQQSLISHSNRPQFLTTASRRHCTSHHVCPPYGPSEEMACFLRMRPSLEDYRIYPHTLSWRRRRNAEVPSSHPAQRKQSTWTTPRTLVASKKQMQAIVGEGLKPASVIAVSNSDCQTADPVQSFLLLSPLHLLAGVTGRRGT